MFKAIPKKIQGQLSKNEEAETKKEWCWKYHGSNNFRGKGVYETHRRGNNLPYANKWTLAWKYQ